MFGVIFHPLSVWRTREVAEMSAKVSRAQVIDGEFVLRVSPHTNSGQPPQLTVMQQTLPDNSTLEFSVIYSLREYLSIVQEHAPIALAARNSQRGKPLTRTPKLLNVLLIPLASVAFFFKKRRMPICHFTISDERIKRVTQDGVLEIPWTDIVAVHRYKQGYLVQKSKGAVPLPYRCLTVVQTKMLETFIQQWSGMQR
jgi:hypothetical protein